MAPHLRSCKRAAMLDCSVVSYAVMRGTQSVVWLGKGKSKGNPGLEMFGESMMGMEASHHQPVALDDVKVHGNYNERSRWEWLPTTKLISCQKKCFMIPYDPLSVNIHRLSQKRSPNLLYPKISLRFALYKDFPKIWLGFPCFAHQPTSFKLFNAPQALWWSPCHPATIEAALSACRGAWQCTVEMLVGSAWGGLFGSSWMVRG